MKTAKKKKPRKLRKKILAALLFLLVMGLITLSVLLYGPITAMASLEKVDDFPLYVMRYHGEYFFDFFAKRGVEWGLYRKVYDRLNPAACTSFAALAPQADAVFGRNFDWKHRSALMLFTEPPNGYASVSMVDLFYLGLEGLQEIPWARRINLLGSPYATIDGMNECGVAIAQNAVSRRNTPKDPNRPTLLNSQIARLVLDHAKDVDEAVTLIRQYNIDFADTPVHFHIADASGKSAIVEYVDGGISVVRGNKPWQVSTNFLFSEASKPECWRYSEAAKSLGDSEGSKSADEAMSLLQNTSQDSTMWSVVYNLTTGQVRLAMGKDYEHAHTFDLKMKTQRKPVQTAY